MGEPADPSQLREAAQLCQAAHLREDAAPGCPPGSDQLQPRAARADPLELMRRRLREHSALEDLGPIFGPEANRRVPAPPESC